MRELLCSIAGLAAVVACTSPASARPGARHVITRLCRLDDVEAGTSVRVSGYEIGRVATIRPETVGTRVRYRVMIALEPRATSQLQLRRGDRLVVRPTGLLSADALDVVLGPRTAPTLVEGDSLPGAPRPVTPGQRRQTVRLAAAVIGLPLVTAVVAPGSLRPDSACAVP